MNHPTIRTLSGVTAPEAIKIADTALLVIDFQNEYFSGAMPIPDGERALHNAQRLIKRADQVDMPVYHIQHIAPASSPIFTQNSFNAQFHSDLQPAPQHTVLQKTSVSVFSTTDLDQRLKAAGIKTLIISGLMTHACVSGAARDAVPLGYSVLVVDDACATRALDNPDGTVVSHHALHCASLCTIDDTFGDIVTTEQLLALSWA